MGTLEPLVWHVMNRAIQGVTLFSDRSDYDAFVDTLVEATERFTVQLFAYCVMPNHWHLVVRPGYRGELSRFMQWLAATHAERWRVATGTSGRGAVYQGRFRGVPVEEDRHFLRVCRYVERNPLRARLVDRAEHWLWSSARTGRIDGGSPALAAWPVERPEGWIDLLNRAQPPVVVDSIRSSLSRGVPYGTVEWCDEVVAPGASVGRGRGRPRRARNGREAISRS
jgi:putative transposase